MSLHNPYAFLVCAFDKSEPLAQAQRTIRNACRAFGFRCIRSDELQHSDDVMSTIYKHIADAAFVVADLTLGRPNCYYEVGYADALKRPLVLIARTGTRVHFDLGGRNLLRYGSDRELGARMRERIRSSILYSHGPEDEEDDNKGAFGRAAFVVGYLATGTVEIDREEREYFKVRLAVRSVKPNRPLCGAVRFHLHHTVRPRQRTVQAWPSTASGPTERSRSGWCCRKLGCDWSWIWRRERRRTFGRYSVHATVLLKCERNN